MRFDVTKLPMGGILIGFVFVAVVVTFVLAFAFGPDSGIDGPEGAVAELSPTPEATSEGGETAGEGTAVVVAMVPVIQFDKTEVAVTAGQPVTVTAENQEPGVFHNWAVYTSREAADSGEDAIAATPICADCTETVTFDPPPAGTYFFRCDVHPIQMVGTFTVT